MSNRMKKIVVGTLILLVLAITAWYAILPRKQEITQVHYHAGFRVYLDNELQDFSSYQYMNFTPCSEHEQKKSVEEEQIEKAHLHDSVGDVVHVHRKGATWGDLFKNLKVEFPEGKEVVAFVDGKEIQAFMSESIEPYTSLIVSIGEQSSSRSGERIERSHIEAKSELCGA